MKAARFKYGCYERNLLENVTQITWNKSRIPAIELLILSSTLEEFIHNAMVVVSIDAGYFLLKELIDGVLIVRTRYGCDCRFLQLEVEWRSSVDLGGWSPASLVRFSIFRS